MSPMACNYCGGTSGHDPNCYLLHQLQQGNSGPSSSQGGGCGLYGVGCLVLVVAALVAAATFAFDVVVGQLMPDRGLTERQIDAIEKTTGTWEGSYVCNGERRAMRLTVERDITRGAKLTAELAFWEQRRMRGEPVGITSLKGTHDGHAMYLVPDGWVKPARGYVPVPVKAATPAGDPLTMSGELGRECGEFKVTKTAANA